jgi:hypothetical protein
LQKLNPKAYSLDLETAEIKVEIKLKTTMKQENRGGKNKRRL